MTGIVSKTQQNEVGLRWGKAALLSLPMLLLTALLLLHGHNLKDPLQAIAAGITYLFANYIFFKMLRSGRTHRYRSMFFVAASVLFVISFLANMFEMRGTMELSTANILDGEAPLCPLVIPALLIPAALTQTIIFPGSMFAGYAGVATMIVLWIGFSIAVGRGWCSWICFFGGMDEGMASLCKKPSIRSFDQRWTYLPWAVLLAVVLLSAATLSPAYCEWLCPFKTVTEYPAVNSLETGLQAVIFVLLFLGLVIYLPLKSGKRTQCGLFCPFGAFQSLFNRCNSFAVRIDRTRCIDCKSCIKECPTFSLNEANLAVGETRSSCTKCGRCIDRCPRGAIAYHIKGTEFLRHPKTARLLFLYPAFLFMAAIGGACIFGGLLRLLKLLTTGSMIG